VLSEYLEAATKSYLETEFDTRPSHFDQMPPFHIILNGVNEVPLETTVLPQSTESAHAAAWNVQRIDLMDKQSQIEARITANQVKIDALEPLVLTRETELADFESTIKPFQLNGVVNDLSLSHAVALSQSRNPFITNDFTIRRDEGHVWKATYLQTKYDLAIYNPGTKTWDLPSETTVLNDVEALIGSPSEQVPQYDDLHSGLSLYSNLSDQLKSEYDGYRDSWIAKNVLLDGYAFWEAKATELGVVETQKDQNAEQAEDLGRQTEEAGSSERAEELSTTADEYHYFNLHNDWLLYEIDPSLLSVRILEANQIKQEANQTEDPQGYLELNYHGARGQLAYNMRMNKALISEQFRLREQENALIQQINKTVTPAREGVSEVSTGSLVLYNIHLFATGTTFSVHDIYTEVMYQYMAEYMVPFKSSVDIFNFKIPSLSTTAPERLSNRAANFTIYENQNGDRAEEDFLRLPRREE
jgi:hypothetical protein